MISASRQIIASRVCFRRGFSPWCVFPAPPPPPHLALIPFIWKIEVYHFTSRSSANFLYYCKSERLLCLLWQGARSLTHAKFAVIRCVVRSPEYFIKFVSVCAPATPKCSISRKLNCAARASANIMGKYSHKENTSACFRFDVCLLLFCSGWREVLVQQITSRIILKVTRHKEIEFAKLNVFINQHVKTNI